MVMELIRATSHQGGFSLQGLFLIADKPLLFIFEQYIESGKRTIDAGYVLLQIHFLFIAKSLMSVDLLFQHPQAVPRHYYFPVPCVEDGSRRPMSIDP